MTGAEDLDRLILAQLNSLTPDEANDPGTWLGIAGELDYWFRYCNKKATQCAANQKLAQHPPLFTQVL